MKKFISKILIILVISILITISLIETIYRKELSKFVFITNSVSYNAKAAHALKSPKFNHAKLFLIGSSMTLDNISAGLLEDSLKLTTYNFASWSMKLGNFIDVIQPQNEYIYSNISFIDFQKSWVEKKYNYPLGQNKLLTDLNILEDFQTFKNQIIDFDNYTSKESMSDYRNLNFDSSGSVLFPKENFRINQSRWNQKTDTFSYDGESRFIEDIGKIIDKNKKATLIISFSPAREVLYNKNNSDEINRVFNKISTRYKSVHCFNHYDLQYPDSLFVDYIHLNNYGAIMYSNAIVKDIKSVISN